MQNDTGLVSHAVALRETVDRKSCKETVDKQTALRRTLELVIDAIRDE